MLENINNVILFQIDKTSKASKLYSQREFERLKLNITVEQWILLKIVHENSNISQKDIALKSLRDPASITRTLDLLQKKGLIERQKIPNNRRKYNVILTPSGMKFIDSNMHIIKQHREKSLEGISNKEIEILSTVLKKIRENMF